MVSWLTRIQYRLRARALYRRLDGNRRGFVREIAADVSRRAKTAQEAETLAGESLVRARVEQGTSFGIAEVLLIIQVIVAIWRLLDAMGLLESATTEKVGEVLQ